MIVKPRRPVRGAAGRGSAQRALDYDACVRSHGSTSMAIQLPVPLSRRRAKKNLRRSDCLSPCEESTGALKLPVTLSTVTLSTKEEAFIRHFEGLVRRASGKRRHGSRESRTGNGCIHRSTRLNRKGNHTTGSSHGNSSPQVPSTPCVPWLPWLRQLSPDLPFPRFRLPRIRGRSPRTRIVTWISAKVGRARIRTIPSALLAGSCLRRGL